MSDDKDQRIAELQADIRGRELHHFETEQENAELKAEVERLRAWEPVGRAMFEDAAHARDAARARADAAEATLAKVAALADEWETWGTGVVAAARAAKDLRAALASADAPGTSDGEDGTQEWLLDIVGRPSDGEAYRRGYADGTARGRRVVADPDRFPTPNPDYTMRTGWSHKPLAEAHHLCDSGNFDRTVCPEPCGAMHSYCGTCGKRADRCAHDRPASPVVAPSATDEDGA